MPNDPSSKPGEDAEAASQPNPQVGNDMSGQVTEDLGGVQGSAPAEDEQGAAPAGTTTPGSPTDQPAPDAGEIEWAGQLVKKPPTPGAYTNLR